MALRKRYADVIGQLGSGGLTNSATTHTFASLTRAGGSSVPTLAAGESFLLSILDGSGNVLEVVLVTAWDSGTKSATIVRGREGTTGIVHAGSLFVTEGVYPSDLRTTTPTLTDPTTYSWSWRNQGVASVADVEGAILLSSPAEGADNWHFREKAVPAKPYSITIHMAAALNLGANYPGVGVGWFQTSNNRFAIFDQRGNAFSSGVQGPIVESSVSTTAWGLTANYVTASMGRMWEWVKLTDDATNRQIWLSADGRSWFLFHSVATNDTVTPDRLIFGLEARQASYSIAMTIDHWEEAA